MEEEAVLDFLPTSTLEGLAKSRGGEEIRAKDGVVGDMHE